VDAPDLNLNISREILQQDRLVQNIRRNLVKKMFSLLESMDDDTYKKFYTEFGTILKIGVHSDPDNKKKIADLIRYPTTKSDDEMVALKDYVERMQPDQKEIYYITGENLTALLNSPHLEQLKAKEYEVLLLSDPVDEWVVQSLTEYDGKPLKSAEKGDLGLEDADKKETDDFSDVFGVIRTHLQDQIKEVKASTRLTDSVSCLSGDDHDMSAYMEKILKASGQQAPDSKRVLELNTAHPVMAKVKALFENDREDPRLKDYSDLLMDLAVIAESLTVFQNRG
jgi:molecular chaperone HtpG